MTIDEAIKQLRNDTQHPTAKYLPDLMAAIQLGIEALERIVELRATSNPSIYRARLRFPLPSEKEKME